MKYEWTGGDGREMKCDDSSGVTAHIRLPARVSPRNYDLVPVKADVPFALIEKMLHIAMVQPDPFGGFLHILIGKWLAGKLVGSNVGVFTSKYVNDRDDSVHHIIHVSLISKNILLPFILLVKHSKHDGSA